MTFAADLSSYDPDAYAKEQGLTAAGWRFDYPSSRPTSDGLMRAEVLLTAPDSDTGSQVGERTYFGEGLSEDRAEARMRALRQGLYDAGELQRPELSALPDDMTPQQRRDLWDLIRPDDGKGWELDVKRTYSTASAHVSSLKSTGWLVTLSRGADQPVQVDLPPTSQISNLIASAVAAG